MLTGNGYDVYKNNSVTYASKEQLLLMLVEGAVKFAKVGKQAILDKDISKANTNIIKAQNIYYELMATLDVNAGGDWARGLMQVYNFIIKKLVDANIKKDAALMDEVIPLMENIKNTWEQAYKLSKGVKQD